jgi:hypothetical protein
MDASATLSDLKNRANQNARFERDEKSGLESFALFCVTLNT